MADKKTDKQLKHLKSDFGNYWHVSPGLRRNDSRDSVSSSDRSADVTPAPGAASPPPGRSSSARHKHSRSHGSHGSQAQTQSRGQQQHQSQHRRNNSSADKTRSSNAARGSNESPAPSPVRSSVTSNPRRHKNSVEPSPSRQEPAAASTSAAASASNSAPDSSAETPAQPTEEETAADETQADDEPSLVSEEPHEDIKPSKASPPPQKTPPPKASMSQRGRSQRGPNRNSGVTEEQNLWQTIQESARTIVDDLNADNDNLRALIAQDEYMAKNKDTMEVEDEEKKYEAKFREGVKANENLQEYLRNTIEKLQILSALQKAKEQKEAESRGTLAGSRSGSALLSGSGGRSSSRAGTRERGEKGASDKKEDKDPSSLYDFDGAGDSPVPSPIGGHTRKLGGSGGAGGSGEGKGGPASDRSGNRDSVPPRGGDRDTPAKADSVEPQLPGSAIQRSRVNFIKGQDVAFKPKAANSTESSDWYLGKVQQVLGEGKSRRYKVKDEDPDVPPEQRQEYRTSASSMIPIPGPGQELSELDKGKTVLALYPDSTTFYKAEVMGTDKETGKVNLRFEGEENSGTLQVVERRFVVEYRN